MRFVGGGPVTAAFVRLCPLVLTRSSGHFSNHALLPSPNAARPLSSLDLAPLPRDVADWPGSDLVGEASSSAEVVREAGLALATRAVPLASCDEDRAGARYCVSPLHAFCF